MKYLVVFEKSKNGYGAYAPDLPGLGVVGRTLAETRRLITEGIDLYLEETIRVGDPIPKPSASAIEYEAVKPQTAKRPRKDHARSIKGSAKKVAAHA